jgi:uncharacterized repeat protein (TIGR01451 family)
MKNNKKRLTTYLIITILVSTCFVSITTSTDPRDEDDFKIVIEKMVWNGKNWADYADVSFGDTVQFKGVVYNPNNYSVHFSGVIYDIFPDNLRYIENSSTLLYLVGVYEVLKPEKNAVFWYNIPTLFPYESHTFYFNATAVECGLGTNELYTNAYVGFPDPSPYDFQKYPVNDSDEVGVNVICPEDHPDISVEKYAKNSTGPYQKSIDAKILDDITFKIFVNNTGTTDLDITVRDELPNGLEYNGVANPLPDNVSGNIITWILTDTFPGESIIITFNVKVVDYGNLTNLVNVTGTISGYDPVYDEDTATVNIKCPPPQNPEIYVEKYVKWDCTGPYKKSIDAEIGDYVVFKIYVNNTGDTELEEIIVRDELPNGLEYNGSIAYPIPHDVSGNIITWYFYDVLPGVSKLILFNANVIDCGNLTNLVNITGIISGYDSVYDEDTATVNVECPEPENDGFTVEKYVKWDCTGPYKKSIDAEIGDYVVFKIYVNNTGDTELEEIIVRDELPNGLEYNGSIAYPIPHDVSGNIITWYFYDVLPGVSKLILFNANVIDCGNLTNLVNVTGSIFGYDPIYHEDIATVNVECPQPENPDISVEKYVKNSMGSYQKNINAEIGDEVFFKLYINNTGNTELDITVRDELPNGLEYNGVADPLPNDVSGNIITWYLYDVQPADSTIITFNADVIDFGNLTNLVNVTGTTTGYSPVYDEDTATVIVECSPPQNPNISVEKYVMDNEGTYQKSINAEIGDEVFFIIYVNNTGDTDLDITVRDELPTGQRTRLEYNDNANIPPNNIVGNIITWYLNDIIPTESVTITFSADVVLLAKSVPPPPDELINLVNVTGTIPGHDTVYDEDTASVIVGSYLEVDINPGLKIGKLNADIKNNKNNDLSNINWGITVKSIGLLKLIDKTTNNIIKLLKPNAKEEIQSESIWGLGRVKIEFKVTAQDAGAVTKTVNGFVIGRFIIVFSS